MTRRIRLARRNRFADDTETRPSGEHAIALAVLTLGLQDAINGMPDAQQWLGTSDFECWCDWAGFNPDYIRRKVTPQLNTRAPVRNGTRYTEDDVKFVLAQRRAGQSWKDIGRHMGVSGENIWQLIKRTGLDPKTVRPVEALK